jgi:hypothetical protein
MLANQSMGYNPLENILNNRSYNSQQSTNDIQGLDMPSITEFLKSQGRYGDTMLAHINPEEAEMLKQMGGSGTINPNTGLPEFAFLPGIFNRKVFNLRNALAVVGTIIGNTILPGVGGVIGGSLGSIGGTALDKGFKITPGKPNYLSSAASGAAIGATLPSAASLAGSGASALGFNNAGAALTNYGNANSITAALGLNGGKGYTGPIDFLTNAGKSAAASPIDLVAKGSGAAAEVAKGAAEKGFLENLISDPKNLLMAGSLASNFLSKQSPEQMGREQKRYQQAMQLTPEEERAKVERELQYYEMKKQKEREERKKNREDWESGRNVNTNTFAGTGFNRTINSPETYARTGRWFEYEPQKYAKGGIVEMLKKKEPIVKQTITRILIPLNDLSGFNGFEDFEDNDKDSDKAKKLATGKFLDGDTHGQSDKIQALLSDGEYVVNASRVADLGDGNNKAGAKFLDSFLKNIAEYKNQHPNKKIPPSLLNKKISYFVN